MDLMGRLTNGIGTINKTKSMITSETENSSKRSKSLTHLRPANARLLHQAVRFWPHPVITAMEKETPQAITKMMITQLVTVKARPRKILR